VEVNAEKIELDPAAPPLADTPDPPAPTLTMYEVPTTAESAVSALAPPPEFSPVTDDL
jgi:hypothetical protein